MRHKLSVTSTNHLTSLQDFTILVLLGAGCLSLGLELLVNRKAGGESSWIEGASILAAGGQLGSCTVHVCLAGGWLELLVNRKAGENS